LGISKSNKLKKKAWTAQKKHNKTILQLLDECKTQQEQTRELQETILKNQSHNLYLEAKYYSRRIRDPDGKKETVVLADFVPEFPDGFVLSSSISYVS
jgi:hypothetical protein